MNWIRQKVDVQEPGAVGFSTWQGRVRSEALPFRVSAFRVLADARGKGRRMCPGCRAHSERRLRLHPPKYCRVHFYQNRVGYLGWAETFLLTSFTQSDLISNVLVEKQAHPIESVGSSIRKVTSLIELDCEKYSVNMTQ